ncbi:protein kinase [Stigmatella sp. ncwal1]|uniref:Protein kinase n=1 Tax=Stigmatella ashevillensis TaxID=2995309 RepID=A0ABT5DKX5_9BACT|nr:protein kinase [Stigmatella ashevillena]MDC0714315.1 protein kinase [Stigmatella ashevillena]
MNESQTVLEPAILAQPLRPYGNYVLVRKLAEGGMAEIFLAKLLGADGFERNVVIKRMLSHLSSMPDFVDMFRDEARLAARLSHPNIIQIHELGFIEGCYYICMEYLAGEDFSTTLRQAGRKRQYTPIPIVLRVLVDAARGLHYAHEFTNELGQCLNIVHRDISPSNLYLTYQGQVKVLDFGIAKAESRLAQTRTGVVKGKYIYMAPEQARGDEVDRRSDVFSLGVSLYESLTNVRPFARENDLAILNALLKGDFAPPTTLRREVPKALEAVVLKAMAPRPENRYATAGEFADALERGLADQVPLATHAQLVEYLRGQFGDERFSEKTRIPALATLKAQAAATPPPPPRSSVTISVVSAQTFVEGAGSAQAMREGASRGRGRGARVLALGTAVGLLLLGAAFTTWRFSAGPVVTARLDVAPAPASAPSPEVALEVPPAPEPSAVAAALPAVEPPPVAVEAPPPEPEKVPSSPAKASSKAAKARVVSLGLEDVQRVVSRASARIANCFERHKADLPADAGKVSVRLTIASSGRVKAQTQGPLASRSVGQCLETQAERLRFPAHRDQEVNVVLPFDYRVAR